MLSFSDIFASSLQDLSALGPKPVRVVVLDTGIDASHEALSGRVVRAVGYRRENGKPVAVKLNRKANNDASGHGTGAAAIIATLAPNARLIDYRVLDDENCGYGGTVLQGLRDAIDSDAEIINVSVAFTKDRYWRETADLLEEAYRRNKIVVAAKRNIPRPGDLGLPAELSNAISVDMGNYGSPFMICFLEGTPIEFSAHGESVLTARAGGGYTRLTGTSFATPIVTAFCALLRGLNRNLKLFEIKTLLKHYAAGRRASSRLTAPNPLEVAPINSSVRYQQVEYFCKSCGSKAFVPDAFSSVKCPACGAVGRRAVLLDPRLYFNVIEEIKATVPGKYCFHDWRHAQDVVEAVYRIIPHCPQLTVRQRRCLLFAALTHDMGYAVTSDGHEAESARIACEIAKGCGYAKRDVNLIQSIVMATVLSFKPRTLCEKIIRDADLFHLGTPRQKERSRLLRKELENCGKVFTDAEWRRREKAFVEQSRFHLPWLSGPSRGECAGRSQGCCGRPRGRLRAEGR